MSKKQEKPQADCDSKTLLGVTNTDKILRNIVYYLLVHPTGIIVITNHIGTLLMPY